MSAKTLIFGSSGFIGGSLARHLFEKNYDVTGFDSVVDRNAMCRCYTADINSIEDVESALVGVDLVFYSISQTRPYDHAYDLELEKTLNFFPTKQIIELSKKAGVKKFVYISSGGLLYGDCDESLAKINEEVKTNPLVAHAEVKKMIEDELLTHSSSMEVCILRPSNIYGIRGPLSGSQGVVSIALNALLNDRSLDLYGDGSAVRDYLYIDDLVRALEIAGYTNLEKKIYNLGTGVGTSTSQLLETVEKVAQKKLEYKKNPERSSDIHWNVLDFSRFEKETSWRAEVSLEQGIKLVYDWLKGPVAKCV